MDTGPVHGLVEVALGRRPLAEVDDGAAVGPLHLPRQGHPGGMWDLRGDGRRARDDVQSLAPPVVGHLPAARVGVVGAGEHGQQDLGGGHAHRQRHAEVAVVREDDVDLLVESGCAADLRALVALGRHHERGLPHPVERPDLLVEPPRQEDGPVHGEHVVVGQAELGVTVGVRHRRVSGVGEGHRVLLTRVVRIRESRETESMRSKAKAMAASSDVTDSERARVRSADVVARMAATRSRANSGS